MGRLAARGAVRGVAGRCLEVAKSPGFVRRTCAGPRRRLPPRGGGERNRSRGRADAAARRSCRARCRRPDACLYALRESACPLGRRRARGLPRSSVRGRGRPPRARALARLDRGAQRRSAAVGPAPRSARRHRRARRERAVARAPPRATDRRALPRGSSGRRIARERVAARCPPRRARCRAVVGDRRARTARARPGPDPPTGTKRSHGSAARMDDRDAAVRRPRRRVSSSPGQPRGSSRGGNADRARRRRARRRQVPIPAADRAARRTRRDCDPRIHARRLQPGDLRVRACAGRGHVRPVGPRACDGPRERSRPTGAREFRGYARSRVRSRRGCRLHRSCPRTCCSRASPLGRRRCRRSCRSS